MANERLVEAAGPLVRAMRPADGIRRARRIDRAIGNDGKLIEQRGFTSAWNGNNPLRLGTWIFWIDGAGEVRKKNGSPTGDTDGVIV